MTINRKSLAFPLLAVLVGGWALSATQAAAFEESPAAVPFAAHHTLPEGDAEMLAELYWSASEVPGIDSLAGVHRHSLLDVVTERYKSRLVDRGPAPADLDRHLERLAASPLAASRPLALAQACAQFGRLGGSCEAHAGYVRRAMVLEAMLGSARMTLGDLEQELAGAQRPSLRAALAAGGNRANRSWER